MKYTYVFLLIICSVNLCNGQDLINLSMNSSYVDDVFFDAETQAITNSSQEWDIAFTVQPMDASIRINDGRGVRLYVYSNNLLDWDSVDVSNFTASDFLYNSFNSWSGAFNVTSNSSDVFDYGWGSYNIVTHDVNGNKIFIIETLQGIIKKIRIDKLAGIDQQFIFTYANIDGSNEVTDTINQFNYNTKSFVYYNLDQEAVYDFEPNINEWDLMFTKYMAKIFNPAINDTVYYSVSGVLHNPSAQSMKISDVDISNVNYSDYLFSDNISTIGYDWKFFNNSSFSYSIVDSLICFINTEEGSVFSIVFDAFEGSSTGNIWFYLDNLTENIGLDDKNKENKITIYPNPVRNRLNLIGVNNANIFIYDLKGVLVDKLLLKNSNIIELNDLKRGIYLLNIQNQFINEYHQIIVVK